MIQWQYHCPKCLTEVFVEGGPDLTLQAAKDIMRALKGDETIVTKLRIPSLTTHHKCEGYGDGATAGLIGFRDFGYAQATAT